MKGDKSKIIDKFYKWRKPNFIIWLLIGLLSIDLLLLLIHCLNHFIYSAPRTILSINFILSLTIVIMIIVMICVEMIHLAKDRALKVINKIIQIKLQALSLEELAIFICQKLQEDLKGKFAIIMVEKDKNSIYGEMELEKIPESKINLVLTKKRKLIINRFRKTFYFYPLFARGKVVGILFAQIGVIEDLVLNFRKILPSISDQISLLLENFKTRSLLNEVKMKEEREKLRSLILSSISHDLKTPLASIIGSLSIYENLDKKNELSKENQNTLISTALEEAKRLEQFISDVLEMTKIRSGGIRVQKQPLNPRIVIEKTLQRFEASLKDYQLEILLSDQIKVNFDPISFEQIIQNLIDNVIKYSPKNTKISIYEELGDHYKVFIQDEGNGVDPAKIDSIFNKFERFTSEEKTPGSGLGLSIVKALMEVNDAFISAENAKEKGLIFILRFHDFFKK